MRAGRAAARSREPNRSRSSACSHSHRQNKSRGSSHQRRRQGKQSAADVAPEKTTKVTLHYTALHIELDVVDVSSSSSSRRRSSSSSRGRRCPSRSPVRQLLQLFLRHRCNHHTRASAARLLLAFLFLLLLLLEPRTSSAAVWWASCSRLPLRRDPFKSVSLPATGCVC